MVQAHSTLLSIFKAIRSLLKPEGLFCQWLPLYQLDLDVLRIIIRTFLEVYPDGAAFLAHYSLKTPMIGLISGMEPLLYSHDWLKQRIYDKKLEKKIKELRLHSPYSLFGSFIANSNDLMNFADNSLLNTDDRPLVTFEAPRFLYTQQQPAYVRLLALIDEFNPRPDQILKPAMTDEEHQVFVRLSSYWEARNSFLHAGVNVPQTSNVTHLLNIVREPLLSVVQKSSDFEAAYDPLLAMAQQLYRFDPCGAKNLLIDLEKANPHRNDARELRKSLFSDSLQ